MNKPKFNFDRKAVLEMISRLANPDNEEIAMGLIEEHGLDNPLDTYGLDEGAKRAVVGFILENIVLLEPVLLGRSVYSTTLSDETRIPAITFGKGDPDDRYEDVDDMEMPPFMEIFCNNCDTILSKRLIYSLDFGQLKAHNVQNILALATIVDHVVSKLIRNGELNIPVHEPEDEIVLKIGGIPDLPSGAV